VVLIIFILNAVISTLNVIEDGALLRHVFPAISWSIGVIIWTAAYV
jgi:hypothetical protein